MNFKHVNTRTEIVPSSKGEIMLDNKVDATPELKKHRLLKNMVILFTPSSYQIVDAYKLTKQQVETAKHQLRHPFTVPDMLFDRNSQLYTVYVDGKTHLTPTNSKRDNEITQMLEARGVKVLRLEYTTTKTGLSSSFSEIKHFVLGE